MNNAGEGLAIEQTAVVPNDLWTKKQLRLAFPKDKYLNVTAMYMTDGGPRAQIEQKNLYALKHWKDKVKAKDPQTRNCM